MQPLLRTLLLTLTFALAGLSTACGAQSFVEGQTGAEPFAVVDPSPVARETGYGYLVVLSEEQGEDLVLAAVTLHDLASLPVGEPVDIAEAGVSIEASKGTLEVFERADGARVVNARNPEFFPAISGTFTLDSREPLAGTFDVTLEDGALVGSFVIR